jgi:hypothetical protein
MLSGNKIANYTAAKILFGGKATVFALKKLPQY